MRPRNIAFFCILLFAFQTVFAQQPPPRRPTINVDPNRQDAGTRRWYDELERRENLPTGVEQTVTFMGLKINESLFTRLRMEALKKLEPTSAEKKAFAEFLKLPKTGLIKLATEKECTVMVDVNNPDNECLNYFLPGKAKAYSFRRDQYSHAEYSDLQRLNGHFVTPGTYTLGLMAFLGDMPIESLNLQNEIVSNLVQYNPPASIEEIISQEKTIATGVKIGNLTYRKVLTIEENATYLMRSVAYKAKFKNLPKHDQRKGSLDDDNRSDVIVVFRVVRKNLDDTILLLWRELNRKDSPKMEIDLGK